MLVWDLEAEVNNGGFNQFFFNSARSTYRLGGELERSASDQSQPIGPEPWSDAEVGEAGSHAFVGDEHAEVEGQQEGALQHDGVAVALGAGGIVQTTELGGEHSGADVEYVECAVDHVGQSRLAIEAMGIRCRLAASPGGEADDPESQIDRVPHRVHLVHEAAIVFDHDRARDAASDVDHGPAGQDAHAGELGSAMVPREGVGGPVIIGCCGERG
jgi:hypothetical protein